LEILRGASSAGRDYIKFEWCLDFLGLGASPRFPYNPIPAVKPLIDTDEEMFTGIFGWAYCVKNTKFQIPDY
jgi:hypothetical protein